MKKNKAGSGIEETRDDRSGTLFRWGGAQRLQGPEQSKKLNIANGL